MHPSLLQKAIGCSGRISRSLAMSDYTSMVHTENPRSACSSDRGFRVVECSLSKCRATVLFVAIGPLLPVFGLLLGRTRTVGTRDIFLLLGLGLHLAAVGFRSFAGPFEDDAVFDNVANVTHSSLSYVEVVLINDGTGARE